MILFATMGQIQGASEYVWAAYAITWVTLAGYSIALMIRGRRASEEAR